MTPKEQKLERIIREGSTKLSTDALLRVGSPIDTLRIICESYAEVKNELDSKPRKLTFSEALRQPLPKSLK